MGFRTLTHFLLALMVVSSWIGVTHAAGSNNVVLYRMGEGGQEALSLLKQQLESRGYGVVVYQGEAVVEKHIEKVNRINRGPGNIFIALQMAMGENSNVLVAAPDAKKGEGRFLKIDEVPGRFAEESETLALAASTALNTKVKHLPLFPLLGVNMPGMMVKIDYKETEMQDVVNKLCSAVEKYLSERTKR
jgi:hypothetical protein